MKTSIIISFFERIDYLRCCLDALKCSAGDFEEVVIADDGSGEGTVARIEALIPLYDFPVVHAWHPKNGFRLAAARNNGIRHATGDYLVFIDCDFLLLPGAIQCHLRAARPGRFVAGLVKYLTEEQTGRLLASPVTGRLLEELYGELPDRPITREHRKFIWRSILLKPGWISPRKQRCSSHFSIHRRDMERINGYDENFVGWGGEDEDIAMRFVKAGFQGFSVISCARALHVWHPHELRGKHWKEGPNVPYLNRDNVPFFCENGLIKQRDIDRRE
ncbi:MAG TPA: glycosyltransferase [Syntrophales bacterium]|nr:glycosyltransferase [Syntrophales bacterium]